MNNLDRRNIDKLLIINTAKIPRIPAVCVLIFLNKQGGNTTKTQVVTRRERHREDFSEERGQ